MKHTPAHIFMSLLVLGLAFTHMSCSNNLSELTGSVSLEIPQSIISNSARTGDDSSELYVVAMVKGDDYATAQYKTIRARSLSSEDRFMKLIDIPAEKNIRIVMSIIDTQGERKYYGSTGTFYVQHGINIQNIRLTRIIVPEETIEYPDLSGHSSYNGHYIGGPTQSFAYAYLNSDGWYKIETDSKIISEGIWEESTDNYVHLTEYIYREINPVPENVDEVDFYNIYPNNIIAEDPMEYDLHRLDSETPYYEFTLRNGVQISFMM
ncbi:MAG: hypothetical protein VZR56_05740 [Treponema sp.]|nr:hypothetical protein [Treponema sp.]